jgi:anti-sigma B factor antagonist
MLDIAIREQNGVTILTLSGRLISGPAATGLAQQVKQAVTAGKRRLLIDLREVSIIDSCGAGELISALTAVRKSGGTLKICNPAPMVQDVLSLTRLNTILDISPTVDAAMASFAEPA